MDTSLERTLAFHCAPSLAGIKPADLISFDPSRLASVDEALEELEQALSPAGIHFRTICRCGRRVLVLVYRKHVLDRQLSEPKVKAFLKRAGYPDSGREAILRHLEWRLAEREEFPHEIGVLLGYPPEDVEGFQRYHGQCYKLSGYWKVYGDEARARERFAQFTRCRSALCSAVKRGVTLTQLFRAA